jgi:hypothetical protein
MGARTAKTREVNGSRSSIAFRRSRRCCGQRGCRTPLCVQRSRLCHVCIIERPRALAIPTSSASRGTCSFPRRDGSGVVSPERTIRDMSRRCPSVRPRFQHESLTYVPTIRLRSPIFNHFFARGSIRTDPVSHTIVTNEAHTRLVRIGRRAAMGRAALRTCHLPRGNSRTCIPQVLRTSQCDEASGVSVPVPPHPRRSAVPALLTPA